MENISKKPNIEIVAKETTSLADLATTALRNKILDLSLTPSEHLEEKMLLERFPFGRTPIREALNRLMAEGLVETKNGRGAYVASMSIWHTLQLLEAYVISERVVASLIKFDDVDFPKKTKEFKEKIKQGTDINQILPEAFALVREASKRTLGLRHFDSQMLGGISLAEGNIAEMKTGEGKTLVATLPAYLNSVIGNKAVLVTVND